MHIITLLCVAISAYIAGSLEHRIQDSVGFAILYALNIVGMILNIVVLYPMVRV